MSVSAITSNSSKSAFDVATDATSSTTGTTSSVSSSKTLGQADFLKLLVTQFQSQDPMKPMDDTAFIAQMAQFSSLQQTQTLTTQMTQMLANQDLSTANSYIGRDVVIDNGDKTTSTGTVSGVEIVDGKPRVVVGDYSYPVSSVVSVKPVAAPSTTTPTNTTPTDTTAPTTATSISTNGSKL
jgi:flagellar basal-body rod modification protein FlgD